MGEGDVATARQTNLLDLPPEIWSKIVKLAVEEDLPINVTCRGAYGLPTGHQATQSEPAITAVCRTIRAEALLHYYEANTFYCQETRRMNTLGSLRHLQRWLNAIGKQNAKSLKALYFDGAWSAPEADVMLGWDDCVMRLRRISMQEYLAEKGSLPEAWRKMSTTHVCRLEMA